MKSIAKILVLLVLLVSLAACTTSHPFEYASLDTSAQANTPQLATLPTKTPLTTFTATLINTLSPTSTSRPTNTSNPTATFAPTPAPILTPSPVSRKRITPSNCSQVSVLGTIGYGKPIALAFSQDGQHVIVATTTNVCVFDVPSLDVVQCVNFPKPIEITHNLFIHNTPLHLTRDAHYTIAKIDNTLYKWKNETGRKVWERLLPTFGEVVNPLYSRYRITDNGDLFFSSLFWKSRQDITADRIDYLFDPVQRRLLYKITEFTRHEHDVETYDNGSIVSISSNGDKVAVWYEAERDVQVQELKTKQTISTIHIAYPWRTMFLSPDGRFLLVSLKDRIHVYRVLDGVHVWNAPFSYMQTLPIPGLQGSYQFLEDQYLDNNIAFSPDGQFIAFAVDKNVVSVWHIGDWSHIVTLRGASHGYGFGALKFSPDGKVLIGVTNSRKDYFPLYYVWNVSTGQLILRTEAYGEIAHYRGWAPTDGRDIIIADVSPGGKYFVHLTLEQQLELQDLTSQEIVSSYYYPIMLSDYINKASIAFTLDERYIHVKAYTKIADTQLNIDFCWDTYFQKTTDIGLCENTQAGGGLPWRLLVCPDIRSLSQDNNLILSPNKALLVGRHDMASAGYYIWGVARPIDQENKNPRIAKLPENLFTPTPTPLATKPAALIGYWVNEDVYTSGTKIIALDYRDHRLQMYIWNSCYPMVCYLNEYKDVQYYFKQVTKLKVKAIWFLGFAEVTYTLTILPDGRLKVVVYTHYIDDSEKEDQNAIYYFKKSYN